MILNCQYPIFYSEFRKYERTPKPDVNGKIKRILNIVIDLMIFEAIIVDFIDF